MQRFWWALKSRKVQVALATLAAAIAAKIGLDVSADVIGTVVTLGVALIVGIAVEDHGRNQGPPG